jgi:glyoxylate reductase
MMISNQNRVFYMSKPLIIVTRKLPNAIESRMSELFDVRLNSDDHIFSSEEMIDAVKKATVLVPTVTDKIDRYIIEQAGPMLKLIANYGVGVDHIDLSVARKKMITVTNTPGVLTEDTADMTMALLLAVPRRLIEGQKMLSSGGWKGWAPTGMLGTRLTGKRLGIIGMGRIGQAVARRAKAFGLSIHYHNRKPVDKMTTTELGATYWESLDQMITQMDIISVNCPHTETTYQLLNERRLNLMQKHAYIINTARGEIIDEVALVKMLEAGTIAGAGLDVFENEPDVNPKLLKLNNVVAVPHMGSATAEGRNDMGQKVLINIKTFIDGHSPPNRIIEDWV